jgi:hypothetical protein
MDPLISKKLFSRVHKKYFRRLPTSNFRSQSFFRLGCVGYNAKNRSIVYTRIHGQVLYNTEKKLTPEYGSIQTARGALTPSELKSSKSENQQSGSGKKKIDNSRLEVQQIKPETKAEDVGKIPDNFSEPEDQEIADDEPEDQEIADDEPEDQEIADDFPEYHEPEEEPVQKTTKINPVVLNSFEHPVFTVKKTLNSASSNQKTGFGLPQVERLPIVQKTPKNNYLEGIVFI